MMPVPGHMVAVPNLLLRAELPRDVGVHLGPHRVEPGADRLPRRGHPRPVPVQHGVHGIPLHAGEPEFPVQVRLHPLEAAAVARIGGVLVAGPGGLAARTDHGSHDERRYAPRAGPGLRTVQHTAHSTFLTADYLSLPITEASPTSTPRPCPGRP